MKRHCVTCLIALSFSFLCATRSTAQEKGAIRGTVIDSDGSPIAAAKVNATLLTGQPTSKAIRYVSTDSDGRFLIDGLQFGRYAVFAMKEEALYPNMSSSFYSDHIFPSAAVTPWAPTAELRVQLGAKAGIITGSVTDSANGAPISAAFLLTRAASPNDWLGTSAPPNYRILLPSSVDVLVEVSEPGFKTWKPPTPLRLQPGEEMRLDIALDPSHDPNLHPSRFLVPDGYVGWLLLNYEVKGAEPVPIEDGIQVYKFPFSGALETSSTGPQRGAGDEYFYYSSDGALREIPADYRNGKGMVWGRYEGTRNGVMAQFGFFVGSEQQYKKFQMRKTRPGPVPVEQPEQPRPQ
ncbi:MAG TPA: carboxypeptidase regulatory-like domain-containing protein [Candidatus Angelobacter sp.]|nr:carboxypeptidase regulatory-like domain-containing protein [Candidatus Angelobacter sp.]